MSCLRYLDALPLHINFVDRKILQLALVDEVVRRVHDALLGKDLWSLDWSQKLKAFAIWQIFEKQWRNWRHLSARMQGHTIRHLLQRCKLARLELGRYVQRIVLISELLLVLFVFLYLPGAQRLHLLEINQLFPQHLLLPHELLHVEYLVLHYSFALQIDRGPLRFHNVTADADRILPVLWRAALTLQLLLLVFSGHALSDLRSLVNFVQHRHLLRLAQVELHGQPLRLVLERRQRAELQLGLRQPFLLLFDFDDFLRFADQRHSVLLYFVEADFLFSFHHCSSCFVYGVEAYFVVFEAFVSVHG